MKSVQLPNFLQGLRKRRIDEMEFIDNRITQLLKIKFPIIEGGMAWVGTPKLAAAISEAGGLGMIGSGSMNADILDEKIECIKQLTEKPFGVNIMLLNPAADSLVLKILEKRVPVVFWSWESLKISS